MKSFCRLKFVLQQNEFLWNVDLKDANCSIHLSNLYEFLCLCFGLGSKPKVFTKLLEVLNYWPVRHVTNWLDPRQYSDGKIDFSITKLRFVINFKKSVLDPAKHIEFLNLWIDTEKITLSLGPEKLQVLQQCQGILCQSKGSISVLTKFIGLLSPTAQAILPARIQFHYLQ